jgi:hypothetical protein
MSQIGGPRSSLWPRQITVSFFVFVALQTSGQRDGVRVPVVDSIGEWSRRISDPALYARVILRMQQSQRELAVQRVQQELSVDAAEAARLVDRF